jgi:outer membrane receptor protein involved in Fe transport
MIREACGAVVGSGRARGWAVATQVLLLLAAAAPFTSEAAEATATADTGSASGAPAAPETSGGAELQTVIVTATRRTEDIKDIPTSVSAIDADMI